MSTDGARLLFLDGLRGWMCLQVVLHHCLLYGPAPGLYAPSHFFGKVCGAPEFRCLGGVAVETFWVISGYSLACVPPGKRAHAAVARWARLIGPFLCMAVVDWLWMADYSPLKLVRAVWHILLYPLKMDSLPANDDGG